MFNQSKTTTPEALGSADAEAALVEHCRQGDLQAFGALVRYHDRRISALIGHLLGLDSTAGEVNKTVQDVFVQAWRTLPSYRPAIKFSTWLDRIAVQYALQQWHRGKRQKQTFAGDDLPTTVGDALAGLASSPADAAALRTRDQDLSASLEHLPEKLRTVILLHYFAHFSCEEIAPILDCPVDAVWAHLYSACVKLRGSVSRLGE